MLGRKIHFPSTLLGSWLRHPTPISDKRLTGEKQKFNNMYANWERSRITE